MSRKSILVVDDEKSQREILEMILSGEGYDVTTASSGEAALRIARERRFDLALTDLKMTGMDGIELLSKLLAFDSSIIVLLLTAHGSIESAKEAIAKEQANTPAPADPAEPADPPPPADPAEDNNDAPPTTNGNVRLSYSIATLPWEVTARRPTR